MPPRRGRGRRGAVEHEDQVDRIKRILEGLVQVVHDVHINNNHDDAPQQLVMPMLEVRAMPRTMIKQFQQLKPLTFYGTPDLMAAKSWLLGIERVFKILPYTKEQKTNKKRLGGTMSRTQSSKDKVWDHLVGIRQTRKEVQEVKEVTNQMKHRYAPLVRGSIGANVAWERQIVTGVAKKDTR
ncbi:hypothetical protein Acr_22g0002430 [Actinidia rufa]|uniref:Uncharacterized protein n=1 Tax=Actinidia rufa TaxID=165716 RepID=A0A7J0GJ98_9ERIC|nr:hypothetical protein Acr_22g0002430 [Actinidia rufa]